MGTVSPHLELRADCARCVGLCCVVPAFVRSSDFALSKPAGTACPHLRGDSRCEIHAGLRERGFAGCTVYDCFGAGQQVTHGVFGGRDWRDDAATAEQMFAVYPVVRDLHELAWYLTQALDLPGTAAVHGDLEQARDETERLASADAATLATLDVSAHRDAVAPLLRRASDLARAGLRGVDRRGADLVGADLRRTPLRGGSLRGALLLGADLRGADLHLTDLAGADLRGARLDSADLTTSLFVTQAQVASARGDRATRLPPALTRPAHWPPRGERAPAPRVAGPGAPA